MDPHTAVGRVTALRHNDPDVPMLLCSTAHPAKFADHVLASLGRNPEQLDGKQTEQPPWKLLEELEGIGARPHQHKTLTRAVQDKVLHQDQCPPDTQCIEEALIDFTRNH